MVPQPKPTHPYRTLGCVFNHKKFLANCQPSDAVELCVFDFTNGSRWKAMSEEALRSVCAPGSTSSLPLTPPLCSPSVVPNEASNQLELEMRYLLAEHRKVTSNLPPKSNICKVHFGIQLKGTFTLKMNHPLLAYQSKITKKHQNSIMKVVHTTSVIYSMSS